MLTFGAARRKVVLVAVAVQVDGRLVRHAALRVAAVDGVQHRVAVTGRQPRRHDVRHRKILLQEDVVHVAGVHVPVRGQAAGILVKRGYVDVFQRTDTKHTTATTRLTGHIPGQPEYR